MTLSFPVRNIVIDRDSEAPLHRQLYRQLRELIEGRKLPSGVALPSTRALAKDIGVGRNTVIAAYDQLSLEGFLGTLRGSGPLVKELPTYSPHPRQLNQSGESTLSARGRMMSEQPYHHGVPGIAAFHPGLPDADNFPFNTWSKLLTKRAKQARGDLFGTYHVTGYPPLCQAIARYLMASRGVECRPEQIIITNGAQSAFDLLARLLVDPGESVWMEEPGYYGAGAAFLAAGAELQPLRVNEDGWNLDPPPKNPRVIFVTPSCHYPLGVTMSMQQRLTLMRMASDWNAWIIEDDYDSEYRFQGQPIPALQGVAAGSRVIFVGTFAKILFPAMRLGYMVVPLNIRDRVMAALSATGQFAPLITQAALADFISEGHLARHLRRMLRLYTERRQYFTEQFEKHLTPWMELHPTDSGIQLVGLFRKRLDDRKIAAEAGKQGINVSPLSMQFRGTGKQSGLLMGFAAADANATRRAMSGLAKLLERY
ncbi:aminotransferase class I/II-fold pyridoxal phosphate-dependent enzyme [Aestuariivirga litoralis]|uniref:rhizopine catabolism transcriptional regulator MocR n=1 Tax=Aestuariivirga litoralis TaxID=2650924 RepID=UPI0018C741D9|nr:PLP-dependent aminotransferase family protein [Aestuariivirga litoralis]